MLPAFPIRVSTDLVHWRHTGSFVFTAGNKPAWADDHFWAPELHRVGERYTAYYTARHLETNRLCIGAAIAQSPAGPYDDIGQPLLSDRVSVLDATFFRDDDGTQYLCWKADAGAGNPSGPICVQELSPDGLSLRGSRSELLRNDLGWEGQLVEAPSVVKREGRYYLFYSGGAYDTPGYALGVARSDSPVTGFVKSGESVLRSRGGRWKGPGHNSIATLNGEDYVLYHAWEGERFRDIRPCLLDRVTWADAWPSINDGSPSESEQREPVLTED